MIFSQISAEKLNFYHNLNFLSARILSLGSLKLKLAKSFYQYPCLSTHASINLLILGGRPVFWGQSYKALFGINYIKNGPNKLNFTMNYTNFDVIYAKKVFED